MAELESAHTMIGHVEQVQQIEQLANSFAAEEAAKTPQAAETAQDEPETADVLEQVFGGAFAFLAPNWGVTDHEVRQLAECYGGLFDKYLPGGMGDYGLEINAIFVTIGVFLPRKGMDRKLPEPEQGADSGDK